MQSLTQTCVNHYPPPGQLLDLEQITIYPKASFMKLFANHYLPRYAIMEESYVTHFLIPAQLPGNPRQIIICLLTNYEEILHNLLPTPWAILVESCANHYVPSCHYEKIAYKSISTP